MQNQQIVSWQQIKGVIAVAGLLRSMSQAMELSHAEMPSFLV